MAEAEHTRTVRVRAPLETVWNELTPLDRLMKNIPEVAAFRLEPDGRSIEFSTRLSWGPIGWKVGRATLTDSAPPYRLTWRGQAPSLQADVEGTFELAPAPSGTETVLTYRAVLHCRHKLIGRLRGALSTYLEGHVNSLPNRVAALAVQHAEADERLSRGPDPE